MYTSSELQFCISINISYLMSLKHVKRPALSHGTKEKFRKLQIFTIAPDRSAFCYHHVLYMLFPLKKLCN